MKSSRSYRNGRSVVTRSAAPSNTSALQITRSFTDSLASSQGEAHSDASSRVSLPETKCRITSATSFRVGRVMVICRKTKEDKSGKRVRSLSPPLGERKDPGKPDASEWRLMMTALRPASHAAPLQSANAVLSAAQSGHALPAEFPLRPPH